MYKKGDPVETISGTKGEVISICGWQDNKPHALKIKTSDPIYPVTTVFVRDLKA